MKTNVKIAVLISAIYIVTVGVLLPAGASWFLGRSSMVRFDPRISKDYNCIFVEGHISKRFAVSWLSRNTPLDCLRLRYTPNADSQQYGIMFIDPRTFAYEAHDCCVTSPVRLSSRLDSPEQILDWMRSQPQATQSPSHTNDAQEIFRAIRLLAPCDLEHFTLPPGFPLKNFTIGYQSIARRDGLGWVSVLVLLTIWIPVVSRKHPNTAL